MNLKAFTAVGMLFVVAGAAYAEPCPCPCPPSGGNIEYGIRRPIQIAPRPPRPLEYAPPVERRPVQIFRREFEAPTYCEAQPKPPIHLHPHCPRDVEIVTICRPGVDLLVLEAKPAEYFCLPERTPLQIFTRIPVGPEWAPTLCRPTVQFYAQPPCVPPEWGCCIPGNNELRSPLAP